jgi:hypothetical protein
MCVCVRGESNLFCHVLTSHTLNAYCYMRSRAPTQLKQQILDEHACIHFQTNQAFKYRLQVYMLK